MKKSYFKTQRIRTLTSLTLLTILFAPAVIRAQVTVCGNSNRETGEGCDDGNRQNNDGCNSSCQLEATGFTCTTTLGALSVCTENCGDGYNFKKLVVVGTACDDGNNADDDGCSASCVVETGYTCSGGSRTTPDTCKETCGDGYNFNTVGTGQPGDPCDDGAKLNNDGCDYQCKVEDGWYCEPGSASDTSTPTVCYEECNDGLDFGTFDCDTDGDTSGCIEGVVTAGWECAGGTYSSPDTCVEVCGDGYHYFEECDDGNYFEYDGCDSYCEVEDGFYFASGYENAAYDVAHVFEETCDALDYGYLDCDCGDFDSSESGVPGCEGCSHCNVMGGYRCQPADIPSDGSSCTEICGDGYNYAEGTACDDGNLRNGDGCSRTCTIEAGYTCDFTDYDTADDCYEICGDGLDYGKLQCDDGNNYEYDGCSSGCEILDGWYCYGGNKTTADSCFESCGDGRNYWTFAGDDSCDDGNTHSGDGCSSGCVIESGYECQGGGYDSADFCHETCGDGFRKSTYFDCDDGNLDEGDGCSSGCLIEDGFYCYGGDDTNADGCYEECGDAKRFHDSSITTFCDDGNTEDGDGCDADCFTETGFYCEGGDFEQPDTCYEVCGDSANYGWVNCDDGNTYDGDGCSSGCDIEEGYDCYGGSSSDADTCYEICGDGLNMGVHECDDGNTSGIDGCSSGCQVEDGWYCFGGDHSTNDGCYEICGDPYHYYYDISNMQCDDNNTASGDGCSSGCMVEVGWDCTNDWVIATDYDVPTECTEVCGDGVRFNTDADYCDTGDAGTAVNGCNADCSVQDGWYCYGGDDSNPDGCYEICGDAYNFDNFDCDDNNTDSGDGCSSGCEVEDGWYCYIPQRRRLSQDPDLGNTVCYEICGDTNFDHNFGDYACQDSNIDNYDGCTSGCFIDDGWYCNAGDETTSDSCYEICGDDYDLRQLECEDGNTVDYDGCTNCAIDDGYYCVDSTTEIVGFGGFLTAYEATTCYDICGDGLLMDQSLYACDDNNTDSNDGCSARCQIERGYQCEGGSHTDYDVCSEICGDGYNMPLTSGDCDDGNNANNDGCSNTCEIEDGWYCYGGTSLVEDTCYEECGDGYDFGNFGCDDGNNDPNDGCSATCSVEAGWTCTGGNATTADTCLDTCGDGLLENDGVTECDDGDDTNQYDGCHNCVVLDGWYCYGGSPSAASGCYEFAGDGLDFGSFDCDNIDNGTFDGCSSGELEDGYYCYGGTRTTGDTCYEICGDNINPSQIDGNADDCDDDNNADGDGCSINCEIEEGYYCYGGSSSTPDGCYEICGDGLVEGNFDCDDGNSNDGDGCSSGCTIETGYECDNSEPSDCYEICGDGLVFGNFECDDGNNDDYDGCDADCMEETGYDCTGGTTSTADTCTKLDYLSGTLAECQAYAAIFYSTCSENGDETAPSFGAMASEAHQCESGFGQCAGTVDADGVCNWSRKLCLTCFKEDGYVKVRVQTNSMPDHCYYASTNAPTDNLLDFEVIFSAQAFGSSLPAFTATTQAELDGQLCASAWPESVTSTSALTSYQYFLHSTAGTDTSVVGVALNGVAIFSGVSELGMDAYAPQSYNGASKKAIAPDFCMGDTEYTTFYHYYTMSPCIFDGSLKSLPNAYACSADSTCKSDKLTYILRSRTSQKTLLPVGIARDGHKIYGPYDSDGNTWDPCEVDVCNGIEINGEYAYVMTTFFPYTVGCFADGDIPTLFASCSANPRTCTSAYFMKLGYALLGFLALFYIILQ